MEHPISFGDLDCENQTSSNFNTAFLFLKNICSSDCWPKWVVALKLMEIENTLQVLQEGQCDPCSAKVDPQSPKLSSFGAQAMRLCYRSSRIPRRIRKI
ncbi:hypothetical protein PILCRDRAFT_830410 [Piloderma croceum F 1598]|uniref:Uncharacterized protein n=1 Tax=Piloderma croceum (strain F 1598) TaxID=765440 RepID=A0A0C3B267_PILCF|nr:hypothetical protein PILCRDRAFT_830410 [Piloderma croceum F 1598]